MALCKMNKLILLVQTFCKEGPTTIIININEKKSVFSRTNLKKKS